MKTLLSSLSVFTLLLLPVQPAHAAIYMGEETLIVEQPLDGDTYAAGGKVVLESNISGDLIVGGGDVSISGDVAEDLMAAGGDLRINGAIGDDARVFGGDIYISNDVDGDVIAFGGRVEIGSDSVVGGDLVVNGGDITVNGDVEGDVIANGGVIYINGTVYGSLKVTGGELHIRGEVRGNSTIVTDHVTLGEDASFRGDVSYWTKSDVDFEAVTLGTVAMDETLKPYKDEHMRKAKIGAVAGMGALAAGAMLYSLLSSLLLIAILVWSTKTFFTDSAKIAMKEPWLNALYGLLYFVATPMLAIFIMVTIIGVPIGATVLALYAISLVFAKPFTAVMLAKVYELKQKKTKKAFPNWKTALHALLALICLKVVGMVPVLGWLVAFGTVCCGFGAMMRAEYDRYLKVR